MSPAAAVAEAARFTATLSLDEPMNELIPWRWFCASGWLSTATMLQMDRPAPPARVAAPETEATS